MTTQFIVSSRTEFWGHQGGEAFVADPFVGYLIEKNGWRDRFRRCEVAPHIRSSADDMVRFVEFITRKQDAYLDFVGARLNSMHGTHFSREFWRRALSISFERTIGLVYEMFLICERFYDPDRHTSTTLNPNSYFTPLDFDDLRYFLEHQSFGREQLFSAYIEEFFPERSSNTPASFTSSYHVREIVGPTGHQPVVGIMGAFFAGQFGDQLVNASGGRINTVGFQRNFPHDPTAPNDWPKRNLLCETGPEFDRFDRYFFRCFRHLVPKVFVEHFPRLVDHLATQLFRQASLKYVVSELWIGDAYEPIALALLKEIRGIKTIYNEHNYNCHIYKASLVPRWAQLCDVYVAHGNYAKEIPNVIPSGSLFDFGYSFVNTPKTRKMTFVTGLSWARNSEFSCLDTSAGCAENTTRRYDHKRRFFQNLSVEIKRKMVYRGYPIDEYLQYWEAYYDDRYLMGSLIEGIQFDDLSLSGKQAMASSELVVLDYVMTAHLESMTMNVPTVILFSGEFDALDDRYRHYIDDLVSVQICHTSPEEGAKFIESIIDDPQAWWSQEKVQAVRRKFLEENLGQPAHFFDYLVNLANH